MIKFFSFLIILVQANSAIAQKMHSRLFVPHEKRNIIELQSQNHFQEEEFESQELVQDQIETDQIDLNVNYGYVFNKNHIVNLELTSVASGEKIEVSPNDPTISEQRYNYKGLKQWTIGYLYKLSHQNISGLHYGFNIATRGGFGEKKESNASVNRQDLLLDFYYDYLVSDWSFFGKIGTHLLGKEKATLFNGQLKTTDSYTQVETDFGVSWNKSNFFILTKGFFGQMTDYNIRTPNRTRSTDKGFSAGGLVEAGLILQDRWQISVGHFRRSDVFNAISDNIQDEIDFEYESGATWLKFKFTL